MAICVDADGLEEPPGKGEACQVAFQHGVRFERERLPAPLLARQLVRRTPGPPSAGSGQAWAMGWEGPAQVLVKVGFTPRRFAAERYQRSFMTSRHGRGGVTAGCSRARSDAC
jgi:hypothetical protein